MAKPILRLAGIEDAWAFTSGHTKTTANYAAAAFEALKKTAEMRVLSLQEEAMRITTGAIPALEEESVVVQAKEGEEPEAKVTETEQKEPEKATKKEEGKVENKVKKKAKKNELKEKDSGKDSVKDSEEKKPSEGKVEK